MVVAWRPKRDADFGGKLCWQNIGPFRVLEPQKHGREYRLQHLTTAAIVVLPVKHLHPYLRLRRFDTMTKEQQLEVLPRGKPVNPGSEIAAAPP